MSNWKQKLSSRKLWAAMLAAAGSILVALLGDELSPEIVSALRAAVTACVAYICGEGAVDVARIIADGIRSAYEIPDVECLMQSLSGAEPSQDTEETGGDGE